MEPFLEPCLAMERVTDSKDKLAWRQTAARTIGVITVIVLLVTICLHHSYQIAKTIPEESNIEVDNKLVEKAGRKFNEKADAKETYGEIEVDIAKADADYQMKEWHVVGHPKKVWVAPSLRLVNASFKTNIRDESTQMPNWFQQTWRHIKWDLQCLGRWLLWIIAGALLGLIAIPGFFVCLSLLGFAAGGIVAGSCAAMCQAGIGNVVGGGCFATAQSLGMLGFRTACVPQVVIPMMCLGSIVPIVVALTKGVQTAC
eukprot:NODE_11094_length_1308_cov_6.825572.p1 GENE.NODE_11094_length_1308_cov_6.825572~~NODE_11094_length_1308_cov_6.825572.p1  ORF type:complete len:276 (-),score=22.79 NODE_11094_length_1308_cov_6.825572:480-1250(-)